MVLIFTVSGLIGGLGRNECHGSGKSTLVNYGLSNQQQAARSTEISDWCKKEHYGLDVSSIRGSGLNFPVECL